jgi:hypothetical protein
MADRSGNRISVYRRRGMFRVEVGEPIQSTISFSVRRKVRANHSSDRDPRGLEERIVNVYAPIVAQHVPEGHARIDRESRGTMLN